MINIEKMYSGYIYMWCTHENYRDSVLLAIDTVCLVSTIEIVYYQLFALYVS